MDKNFDLTFNLYEKKAKETAVYPKQMGPYYSVLGLCSETGKVADKLKKIYIDKSGVLTEEDKHAIVLELGDILWYLANMCDDLGVPFENMAKTNLTKLYSRMIKNKTDNK